MHAIPNSKEEKRNIPFILKYNDTNKVIKWKQERVRNRYINELLD